MKNILAYLLSGIIRPESTCVHEFFWNRMTAPLKQLKTTQRKTTINRMKISTDEKEKENDNLMTNRQQNSKSCRII